MDPTNLFTHATSELSQDAVLAWLLAWAHPDHEKKNEAMHAVGSAFLESLLTTAGTAMPDGKLDSVVVKRQVVVAPKDDQKRRRRIDVAAEVRSESELVVVLIEDKTGSPLGANQLIDTLKGAGRKWGDDARLVPLYLKTHDAAALDASVSEGWHSFERRSLLNVLTSEAGRAARNDILDAFREHLTRIETESMAYATVGVSAWDAAA